MTRFFMTLIPAAFMAAFLFQDTSDSAITFNDDPLVKEVFKNFYEFLPRFENEFINQKLGGIWMPSIGPEGLKTTINLQNTALPISETFRKYAGPFLQYLQRTMHLSYDNGLKCWWAPLIILCDDLTSLVGPIPKEELSSPTLDGMLGPMFRRSLKDNLQVQPEAKTLSDDVYYEWLLFIMNRKEMRRDFGIRHSQKIHEQMESWGYNHGKKWEQRDFNMLFDRIHEGSSLEKIAESHEIDTSTVQRNTEDLANILGLKLPRGSSRKS